MLFPTNENIFTAPKINELKYKPSSIASSMLCDPVATISWYRCADSSKSWTNSAHVFSYSHRPIVDSYKEWKKTQEKKKCSFFFGLTQLSGQIQIKKEGIFFTLIL